VSASASSVARLASAYERFAPSTHAPPDARAAIATRCEATGTLNTVCVATRRASDTTGSGATRNPTRAPASAWLLDSEYAESVRSLMPSSDAIDRCAPS
jgi:hypothetical protein